VEEEVVRIIIPATRDFVTWLLLRKFSICIHPSVTSHLSAVVLFEPSEIRILLVAFFKRMKRIVSGTTLATRRLVRRHLKLFAKELQKSAEKSPSLLELPLDQL